MPKISASAFLQTVNFLSLASAFRHQVQSNAAGHGIVRHWIYGCRCAYVIMYGLAELNLANGIEVQYTKSGIV